MAKILNYPFSQILYGDNQYVVSFKMYDLEKIWRQAETLHIFFGYLRFIFLLSESSEFWCGFSVGNGH